LEERAIPTYEYECRNCGKRFDEFESIMVEVKTKRCPNCGKIKAERLISAGGALIFKGSGFFVTDYKKKDTPKNEDKKSTAHP